MPKLNEVIPKLLSCDRSTYYKWKNENRIIIKFLEQYFSTDELKSIVENDGHLEKLEMIKNIDLQKLKELLNYNDDTMIIRENILAKLKDSRMSRGGLLYLFTILKNQKLIDYNSLHKFLRMKLEPKSFLESLQESYNDFHGLRLDNSHNIIRKGFAKKLDEDLKNYFTVNEINFILKNKFLFLEEIREILQQSTL